MELSLRPILALETRSWKSKVADAKQEVLIFWLADMPESKL